MVSYTDGARLDFPFHTKKDSMGFLNPQDGDQRT